VKRKVWFVVFSLAVGVCPARGESGFGRAVSDNGLEALGLAVLATGLTQEGREHRLLRKAAVSSGATLLATELLKSSLHERRPNGRNNRSFPSGHASMAFSLSTVMAHEDKRHKWFWHGAAAAIAWSRVDVRAHHTHDVLAGAGLGFALGDATIRLSVRRNGFGLTLFQKSW